MRLWLSIILQGFERYLSCGMCFKLAGELAVGRIDDRSALENESPSSIAELLDRDLRFRFAVVAHGVFPNSLLSAAPRNWPRRLSKEKD
jgi:hypothetical protein